MGTHWSFFQSQSVTELHNPSVLFSKQYFTDSRVCWVVMISALPVQDSSPQDVLYPATKPAGELELYSVTVSLFQKVISV